MAEFHRPCRLHTWARNDETELPLAIPKKAAGVKSSEVCLAMESVHFLSSAPFRSSEAGQYATSNSK